MKYEPTNLVGAFTGVIDALEKDRQPTSMQTLTAICGVIELAASIETSLIRIADSLESSERRIYAESDLNG